jgi:Ca2+/Na+ antiporter
MNPFFVFASALFILAAACYLLFMTSEPLEETGGRLGHLLHVPEAVIASTFQALATSGPEIVMAIQAIYYSEDAKACSGLLNMGFSAMDNLVGIGCLGMIYMIWKKTVDREEVIEISHSVKAGLIFYIISSTCLSLFITFDFEMSIGEAWILMFIGIVFVATQFYLPKRYAELDEEDVAVEKEKETVAKEEKTNNCNGTEDEDAEEPPLPDSVGGYISQLTSNGFIYAFCVFGMWVFVHECLQATFMMASVGIVSIAGVLIMFTSYVSSFPEFMMTYRYAAKGKKDALLGMLFGSNVIDLAFAGFRCIWTGEPMKVVAGGLLPIYFWLLPITAFVVYKAINQGKMKFKHAYPMMIGYIIYIVSGFVLL